MNPRFLLKFIVFNIVLQNKFTASNYLRSEANLLNILNRYINEREVYLSKALRHLNAIERSYNSGKDSIYKTCKNNSLYVDWNKYLTYKRVLLDWNVLIGLLKKDNNIMDQIKMSISAITQNQDIYRDWILEQNDLKLLHVVHELYSVVGHVLKKEEFGSKQRKELIRNAQLQMKNRILSKITQLKESLKKFLKLTKANTKVSDYNYNYPDREDYKQLCRGEILLNQSDSNLKCRYFHNNKPYLYISPIKLEELHADPLVYKFHDVLYDGEIEQLRALVKQQNMRISQGKETLYRVSKVTWLHRKSMMKLQKRIELMTNLDLELAENFQVNTYGIAGHYGAHYDASSEKTQVTHRRMASLLFYMNNVAKGGATAFPNLRLTVWPQKGSAIFWYNIKPNYDVDKNSLHGGCPLYIGSKWVLNVWIRRYKQEFRKPCAPDGKTFVF